MVEKDEGNEEREKNVKLIYTSSLIQFLSTFDSALLSDAQPSDFTAFTPTMSSLMHRFNTQPQSDPVKVRKGLCIKVEVEELC